MARDTSFPGNGSNGSSSLSLAERLKDGSASAWGDLDRKHVGAVIVRDKTILSTGYNGSIRGLQHCDEVGHLMEDGHCVRTVHAEANAIVQASKIGVCVDGADIYTTASPCWNCFKLIANAGIRRICFGEFYRDERAIEIAKELGIELIDLSESLSSIR